MTYSGIQYAFPAPFPWSERLVSKLSEREYRHAYMVAGVKAWIARQVRTLREQRDWSQEDLGRETGKPQSAISRVEDPDYGKLTLQTLFELARAYDLPLLVQFVEWSDWLSRMDDTSTETLEKRSFDAKALAEAAKRPTGVPEIGYNGFVMDPFAQQGVTYTAYRAPNLGTLLTTAHTVRQTTIGLVQVYSADDEDIDADEVISEYDLAAALAALPGSPAFGAE